MAVRVVLSRGESPSPPQYRSLFMLGNPGVPVLFVAGGCGVCRTAREWSLWAIGRWCWLAVKGTSTLVSQTAAVVKAKQGLKLGTLG